MNLPRGRLKLIAATAIGVGAVAAFALPAGAAVSLQSQSQPTTVVNLGNQARLDANGAVVFASVTVTCGPAYFSSVNVTVTENVGGGRIASGTTVLFPVCDGTSHKATVSVVPTQRAFRTGVAFGQAVGSFCDETCVNIKDEHTINIVRK
jgi:hypothetical protein